jgi:hypothetical protein
MKTKLKTFRPTPLGQTKVKRRYTKRAHRKVKKIDRPPAQYDNPNREDHIDRITKIFNLRFKNNNNADSNL